MLRNESSMTFFKGLILGIFLTVLTVSSYISKDKSLNLYGAEDDIPTQAEIDIFRLEDCLAKDFPDVGINKCNFLMVRKLYVQSLNYKGKK